MNATGLSMRCDVLPLAGLLTLLAGAGLGGCTQTPAQEMGCAAPPEPQIVCPLFPPPRTLPQQAAPEAHGPERTVSLGRSVRGVELKMCVLGDGGEVTLIVGGIHGDEPAGAGVAQSFLEYLHANPAAYKGRTIAVFARANPDGLAAGTRVNAHGVDVNRSFPASNWQGAGGGRYNGGRAPAAEPETKAIMQAVESLHPMRIISIHAISGGRQCNNWDGPAEDLARRMASHNGYPPKATIGYPTPGSMGTWAGIDHKIAMITLELPEGLSAQECWRVNQQALLEAIR
jgi:murein peptide amidase A